MDKNVRAWNVRVEQQRFSRKWNLIWIISLNNNQSSVGKLEKTTIHYLQN